MRALPVSVSLICAVFACGLADAKTKRAPQGQQAQAFVDAVASSDMLEMESSRLAQDKADQSSKDFAARMLKDHGATTDELKQIVQSSQGKLQFPGQMSKAHTAKLDRLQKAKTDQAFDKAYDNLQREAHKQAIALFQRYAKSGDDEQLRAFAEKHLPDLQQHAQMAAQLKSESQGRR